MAGRGLGKNQSPGRNRKKPLGYRHLVRHKTKNLSAAHQVGYPEEGEYSGRDGYQSCGLGLGRKKMLKLSFCLREINRQQNGSFWNQDPPKKDSFSPEIFCIGLAVRQSDFCDYETATTIFLNSFYALVSKLFDFQLFRFSFGETTEDATKKENQKVKMDR